MNAPWNPRLYDDHHAFVWKHGGELLDLLQPRPGEKILDVGCGTGHLTAELAARGAEVLGVDLSPDMIAEAEHLHPHLDFVLADARRLDFSGRFDAVFSNAALHWVPEADEVLAGIQRSLRPGGRFVAEFGGFGNVAAIEEGLRRAYDRLGLPAPSSPWFFPGIAEYARLLEDAGLEPTFLHLFERPTPLDGPEGLRRWVDMFGRSYLEGVPQERREDFYQATEDATRPTLLRDGAWFADYRRLRVVARRR